MKTNRPNDAIILSTLYNEWLDDCLSFKSECTANSYESTVNIYIEFLSSQRGYKIDGFCASDAFSTENIKAWMLWLRDVKQIKPQSCNVRLSCLRSFLKYLSTRNLRYSSLYLAAKGNVGFFKSDKRQIKSISKRAVKTLLAIPNTRTFIGMRDFILMSLMYVTGCRINEPLSIKLNDLHLSANNAYVSILGKGRIRRSPYLPNNIVANVKVYLNKYHASKLDEDRYLFFSSHKGPEYKLSQEAIRKQITKYAESAHQICKEVPLDFHSHQFRHSMAVHRLEDDMNIVQLSKELRHAKIETTMIYLDVVPGKKEKAIAEIESEEIKQLPRKWGHQNQKLQDIFKKVKRK